jgi:HD-like signal output (HDOD) protein/FixJ family two-component response regulator
MALVMVVDDMAVIREPIAAALRNAGYVTLCAGGGAEALALIKSHIPDLIILDLAMPRVSGMAVLRSLRGSLPTAQTPVILLTVVSDKKVIVEAAKLGVQDYILKSRFSLTELLDRVKKRIEPRSNDSSAAPPSKPSAAPADTFDPNVKPQRLLTREEAITRAEMALGMKTLPGVVMQVISQADSPRTDSAALATLIGRDSMLAARVLQAANSSAYASNRGTVTTLSEAVRNIGCSAVRNVAASVGIFEAMPDNRDQSLHLLRCWQHSLAVAALCERLASLSDICPPNVAYLVGLCHDLGEIVFRTTFAAEYQQILDYQNKSGRDRESVERDVLGIAHYELVNVILSKIGLPDSIRGPIDAMRSPIQKENNPVAKLLSLANLYANGLMLCDSSLCEVGPVTKIDCQAATRQDDPAGPDSAVFRNEIKALTAVLGRLSPSQERDLTSPLVPSSKTRVWLMRDRAFSGFDPVAALLSTLARVTISDKFPQASEAADIDRVIISTRATSGAAAAGIQELQQYFAPAAVLWLVSEIDASVPPSLSIQPRLYPIRLQTMGDFLSTPLAKAAA